MEQITAIARVLENNRERIMEARKIIDSATALALLGASVDTRAREMIMVGTMGVIGGAGVLAGVAITGIAGPVVLGVAVIPTVAKVGLMAGAMTIAGGFVRGFREGIKQAEQSKDTMVKIEKLLTQHGESISNINLSALIGNTNKQQIEVE